MEQKFPCLGPLGTNFRNVPLVRLAYPFTPCGFGNVGIVWTERNTFWPFGNFLDGDIYDAFLCYILGVLLVMEHLKMNGTLFKGL